MNLPNKLTMMRVVLVPVFMVFAALAKYGTTDFSATFSLVAGIIFTVASITDFLDGYIARKNHLFREFAVAGVRMIAAETGTVIAANMWGKVKTVLQMLTIIFYYFAAALAGPTDVGVVSLVTVVLCWLCGAATLLSGCIYLWQNRQLFMQAK